MIRNTYIALGDIVVRQKTGIPMGTNAAPQIADLYLLAQELKFIKTNLLKNFSLCFDLRYVFRYLDDITIINDKRCFSREFSNIYDSSLELAKVNDCPLQADVLDVSVSINNGQAVTKLYDKRKDFNFSVNQLPASDSNVAISMMYSIFFSQLVRFARICSNQDGFSDSCRHLVGILFAKGYSKRKLRFEFLKFCRKKKDLLFKYHSFHAERFWVSISKN